MFCFYLVKFEGALLPPAPPSSPGPGEFSSLRASLFRSPTLSIPRPPLLVLKWGEIFFEGVFSFLFACFCGCLQGLSIHIAGPPRQGRQARFGPCLDFEFQYALIRNKKFWGRILDLAGSNSRWRPCIGI